MNKNLHIVLVRPQYPVNIGLITRTMKNFDMFNLRIVNPLCNIYSEMSIRLSHKSREILSSCLLYKDLASALSDINIVLCATARRRKLARPFIMPEDAPGIICSAAGSNKIAVLFGNEETGMTNRELSFSNYCIRIPSSRNHPALNLSQSVSIILYEIYKKRLNPVKSHPKLAENRELEGLFEHMESLYSMLGYFKEKDPTRMMNIIKNIYKKALLEPNEVRLLRGILSQTDWYCRKKNE